MQADYRTQRLTTGPHPMKLMRAALPDVWRAQEVPLAAHGDTITVAGVVGRRQRPGTAKGFVFIGLEDESGIANVIVSPKLFERTRLTITMESFLRITGRVQTRRGLPLVRAEQIERLNVPALENMASHDFH